MHIDQGMYRYVQKVEGESAGESEGLLPKEVSFPNSFESVLCGCFAERERGGKGVPQDSAAKEEKAREPTVFKRGVFGKLECSWLDGECWK